MLAQKLFKLCHNRGSEGRYKPPWEIFEKKKVPVPRNTKESKKRDGVITLPW